MSASHVSKVDREALRTTRQMKKRDVALTDRRREGDLYVRAHLRLLVSLLCQLTDQQQKFIY